jgi:hypothetical protein
MAYQTGNIKYRGSFKSIRQWRIRKGKRTLAGEKGGANIDLIMNSPVFARTRENMSEFEGCAVVVKGIHHEMGMLWGEHTDTYFTGRLTAIVKMINLKDEVGSRGKRGVFFSANKSMLKSMNLHEKRKIDFVLKRSIRNSHSESRTEATITITGLNPDPEFVPKTAQYYRVVNHLCVISDYAYSKSNKRYEKISKTNLTEVFTYSDYTMLNTPLNTVLKTAFPEGTVLNENDTVLQCIGIEYYIKSGPDRYLHFSSGSMIVYDVF